MLFQASRRRIDPLALLVVALLEKVGEEAAEDEAEMVAGMEGELSSCSGSSRLAPPVLPPPLAAEAEPSEAAPAPLVSRAALLLVSPLGVSWETYRRMRRKLPPPTRRLRALPPIAVGEAGPGDEPGEVAAESMGKAGTAGSAVCTLAEELRLLSLTLLSNEGPAAALPPPPPPPSLWPLMLLL